MGLIRDVLSSSLLLALVWPAYSDPLTYEQQFAEKVAAFANLNRLNIARLHRDIHANCYITVTVATVIRSDGSIADAFIVESSTVPVVDRYFLYVIQNAAPFQPLADHYNPAPEEITVVREFRLDARLWGQGTPSTRPCEKLETNESQSDRQSRVSRLYSTDRQLLAYCRRSGC